jgi:hypothetical protein
MEKKIISSRWFYAIMLLVYVWMFYMIIEFAVTRKKVQPNQEETQGGRLLRFDSLPAGAGRYDVLIIDEKGDTLRPGVQINGVLYEEAPRVHLDTTEDGKVWVNLRATKNTKRQ